jgi:MFS family permease
MCLSVFVVVDNTIVNVALPTLSRHLGASTTSLQWIVDAYSLAFAGLLLAGGGLGDRLGRKGTMQIGLALFGVFSAAAALSHSTGTLITARTLLGVAAAFVFPATLAILTSVFPDPSERQTALGIWGATSGVAVAFGPIVGGALLEHFWYGSIFLVSVPIVLVTLVAGRRVQRPSRRGRQESRARRRQTEQSVHRLGGQRPAGQSPRSVPQTGLSE